MLQLIAERRGCMSTCYSAVLDDSYSLNIRTQDTTRSILSTKLVPDVFCRSIRRYMGALRGSLYLSSIAQYLSMPSCEHYEHM